MYFFFFFSFLRSPAGSVINRIVARLALYETRATLLSYGEKMLSDSVTEMATGSVLSTGGETDEFGSHIHKPVPFICAALLRNSFSFSSGCSGQDRDCQEPDIGK